MSKTYTLQTDFSFGDIVFLRMAEDRYPGMITSYKVCPLGVMYYVAWDDSRETCHYAIELTTEYSPVAG